MSERPADTIETRRERFGLDFWERAQYRFVRQERALGASWTDAYLVAWQQADEVLRLFYSDDRPHITLGKRTITT